jgi:hypothetical protein
MLMHRDCSTNWTKYLVPLGKRHTAWLCANCCHVLIATAIAVHSIVVHEKKRHPAPRAPDAEDRFAIQSGGSIAQESSVEPGNS